MSEAIQLNCFSCGKKIEFPIGIVRRDECDHCGADVHACKNCRFYDTSSYNECKETSAEVCIEKERSNFCDYFEAGDGGGGNTSKDDLMAAADALFKKD